MELLKSLEKAGKKRKPAAAKSSYGLTALQELGRNSGKKTPTAMRDMSPNTSAKKKKPQKIEVNELQTYEVTVNPNIG